MTQEQKWLSYVAELREKHDNEISGIRNSMNEYKSRFDKLVSDFEDLKAYDNTLEGENRSHIDTINGQEYRIMELEKEKNEAFELLAQCTLRRNASEMRIEELKKQLMLMQIKLNNRDDENDGKSGYSPGQWSV